ncbi:RNA ligase/cyclic nucleotide phosphodiesterase [Penicillium waksmanii]|uniref:RNA ligase/cyclic nucleotide phosphodiesterase n=1 Tax=Penicillium waksmanii TaxID=69791 RepID=UPI00254750E8|nr:RNA ligase/cyclic nucleotide phosphodiesterase [Penicillium waksmanii]KAJ5979737.1 RNA ligase/cyclic nucleotide phosphodiesterase [Penicillium waksmanii]
MSSITISTDNPFQKLITETQDDPAQLQYSYENHRVNRNAQQQAIILADDFPGWKVDDILMRLDGPRKEDDYIDPRNCLVFWGRPPSPVRDLIAYVQDELKAVAPSLWTMPLQNLHITVLEVAHSLTKDEIEGLVQTLKSSTEVTPNQISEYPTSHKTRLLKPIVSFDSAALALSFVPAAGEPARGQSRGASDDYSYHHLRRDIFDLTRQANLPVASRYVVPSAHLTIARFINHDGFLIEEGERKGQIDRSRVKILIDKIDEINKKLESEYWPQADGTIREGGEFIVGGKRGLTMRRNRVWYGGGEDM